VAQIVSKAAQSEMRIGLNTSAFGSVEVRTLVHANDVGIQIGSEKGDLRSLLSNDLPVIASSLQRQDIHLTQVSFHQQGFAFSSDASSGGNPQPRWFASIPNSFVAPSTELPLPEAAAASAEPSDSRRAGFSILA
jgi:flagellar hook-length control protein FliK